MDEADADTFDDLDFPEGELSNLDPEVVAGMRRLRELRRLESQALDFSSARLVQPDQNPALAVLTNIERAVRRIGALEAPSAEP